MIKRILLIISILTFYGCEDKNINTLPISIKIKKICTDKALKFNSDSKEYLDEFDKCVELHRSITKSKQNE